MGLTRHRRQNGHALSGDLDAVVAPGEQTCMGMGVSGAIGAKLARPDKKVCLAVERLNLAARRG